MKILITEDDIMLADFLEEAVTELGHTVCGVAREVREAVGMARLHRPDVAILDMQLAGAEMGSDIVDQLAASGDLGRIGILYITGESDRVYREARFGHACLTKPYSIDTLDEALAIVRDIAVERRTSHKLPHGMGLLFAAQMDAVRLTQEILTEAAGERGGHATRPSTLLTSGELHRSGTV